MILARIILISQFSTCKHCAVNSLSHDPWNKIKSKILMLYDRPIWPLLVVGPTISFPMTPKELYHFWISWWHNACTLGYLHDLVEMDLLDFNLDLYLGALTTSALAAQGMKGIWLGILVIMWCKTTWLGCTIFGCIVVYNTSTKFGYPIWLQIRCLVIISTWFGHQIVCFSD